MMTAAEAGNLDLIDLIIDSAEKKLEQFDYCCETGSPLHAAITGQKPLETVNHFFEKLEMVAIEEGEPDYPETYVNKRD